ncbi:hypothetical protein R1sor_012590 [Riccia sorocarpa]|uniref:Uncharacterized protein n=1 Tax=Riccia sorocarpa TaxID=122646 RepID=A0ABD3I642_9MARC
MSLPCCAGDLALDPVGAYRRPSISTISLARPCAEREGHSLSFSAVLGAQRGRTLAAPLCSLHAQLLARPSVGLEWGLDDWVGAMAAACRVRVEARRDAGTATQEVEVLAHKFMGRVRVRVENSSEGKMNGKQRIPGDGAEGPASAKKRKVGQGTGGAEPTPSKDRRAWSPEQEAELVKILVDDKAGGKTLPLTSRSAAYWTDMMAVLYPGDKGVNERRLYDKVRRMITRYAEIKEWMRDKKAFSWKNANEKIMFDSWEKIFADQILPNVKPATKARKASNPKRVVEESSSEDEEDEEEHEEERIPAPAVKVAAPPVRPRAPVQASSESDEDEDDEEEDDEDEEESSPEKPRPIQSGENGARFETNRSPRGELPKTPLPRMEVIQRSSQARGAIEQKEKTVAKDRPQSVANGSKRQRDFGEEGVLDAGVIKSLKAELFAYVHKLRDDCMRELDVVKNQLMSPARLQLARKRQELFLEELALQEKELEINRRYCHLQKEVLNLQNTS